MKNTDAKKRQSSSRAGFALVLGLGVPFVGVHAAPDVSCIDYYTVGESHCPSPQQAAQPAAPAQSTPVLLPPASAATQDEKVKDFLANYGKPPREFVEFYLNPTPENAQKWVKTYQGILQKSQNMSQMWSQAEEGVSATQTTPAAAQPPSVAPQASTTPATVPAPTVSLAPANGFGGLSAAGAENAAGLKPQPALPLNVTYYFSQTCPYCARTTPELSAITSFYKGKLELTCVDVTPFNETVSPNPAFMSGKLACNWRLPKEGELEANDIRLTPTLLIARGDNPPVRLSGYMSQAQLAPYFQ